MNVNDGASRRWRVLLLALLAVFVTAIAIEAVMPASVVAQHASDRKRDVPDGDYARLESARDALAKWQRRRVDAEVVGGNPVSQGTYPFVTLVLLESNGDTFQCGGSLIDPGYVLTAAHCVEDEFGALANPSDFTLVIGDANVARLSAQNLRGVAQVSQHPGWDPVTFRNDVAVLQLDHPISGNVARPIPFVQSGQTRFDHEGQLTAVAGWGATSTDGYETDQLRAAGLRIVSDSACTAAYGREFEPQTMICAAFKKRDSCYGDSGGPLMAKELIGHDMKKKKKGKHKKKRKRKVPVYTETQMGIISFGGGICADPDLPGVYTRLSAPGISDFIVQATNE